MSVENPEVVDAIGIDNASGDVVLTISDHLEWDAAKTHLLVLQDKINRYIGFIESGELLTTYSKAEGRKIRIEVCCKYCHPKRVSRFLTARNRLSKVRDGHSPGLY